MTCDSTYYETFAKQFFTTLGQLTAAAVSASFVIPMYEYYVPKLVGYFVSKNAIKKE